MAISNFWLPRYENNEIIFKDQDAYRDQKWIPPDTDKARDDAAAEKYLRGKGPLLDTTLEQLGELGVVSARCRTEYVLSLFKSTGSDKGCSKRSLFGPFLHYFLFLFLFSPVSG